MKTRNYSYTIQLALLTLILALQVGCQTTSSVKNQRETGDDVQRAVGAVAEAVAGQPLSEEEVKRLQKELREEPQAQTAVQSITDAVSGKPMIVKYCPLTGKRYAADIVHCPVHTVELKTVEP